LINPEILSWARQRANLAETDLARKISLSNVSKIRSWEAGEDKPTFDQAQNIAKILHIPFGYLFLDTIPEQSLLIPDLRTVGRRSLQFSLELEDVYEDALLKQAWLREYRHEEGMASLSFVGSSTLKDSPTTVAKSISDTLRVQDLRETAQSWEKFFASLIESSESVGVTVLRSSTVGANTHRPLLVEEFRGFAISDRIAPFVFINTKDAKAAQIFTLVHELAHVWLAETGISLPDIELEQPNQGGENSEAFCDQVAAETLVPRDEFLVAWNEELLLSQNCEHLSKHFCVSQIVVARRSNDLGLSGLREYREYLREQMKLIHAHKEKQRESDGGPPHLVMVRQRNSHSFTEAVVTSAVAGRLLYRDAASLLGVKPKVIDQLAAKIVWTGTHVVP
jgi:Zn-dependent peptidase ImmA (M78 family)/transcriptional regulator with XRE-family HTH domain